jgi:hypothetical protein
MLIREMRPVCVGLCVALLSFAFATGTSADESTAFERSHAMVERVLPPLHEVYEALTHRAELKPEDWSQVVRDMQIALDTLHEYQRQSP